MPARRPTPTLRLRRLAAELRRLRAEAGLTREDVAGRTGVNEATLYRIETAKARPQGRTLTALLELYGVAEDDRPELLALARQSSEQSWLQSFPSELPEPYPTYISFEGEARSLLNYESLFIPGLLQTEEYARAALSRGSPNASKDEIQRLVEARMSRQAVLTRDPALRLWAIVDEAAFHRLVGGEEVMRIQLEHLAEAFVILQFDDPGAPDVVYVENGSGDLFMESEADVARYTVIFEHLRALALPPDASVSLIMDVARGLK